MNQTFPPQFERDCDTALGWITRFRAEDASEDDHRAFALWLAADAGHREAMDLMLELWDDLGSVRHLPFEEPLREAPANRSRRGWLGAAAALAASLAIAAFILPMTTNQEPPDYFQTAVGERQTVVLEDQSRVTLNTDTRIEVSFKRSARDITLLRGEAYFEVRTDPDRPFQVNTGSADVTAIGTAFNIHIYDGMTDITVTEGVVRVSERDKPAGRPAQTAILHADEQLQASRRGLGQSYRADTAADIAWQQGELIARELPLAQLVGELARYHDNRILISDREVATLTVSGVFDLDHPESVLLALERSFALEVERLDDNTVRLLKPRQ
ncbi:hypothetical protein CWI75_04070 [Kineobactrum sediminis]|uniref:Iron dicitrate transport regulator FecR n=1 Tax=Kineobactrum sediminis TaxID=1905677 RepID=A0A2N5Y577_9GAMM|nr:FecR family protein [Kineobactrum sediminis]PLW83538.1 hypothetical protein CWI75_04070 [Kineobactrum sediminis]